MGIQVTRKELELVVSDAAISAQEHELAARLEASDGCYIVWMWKNVSNEMRAVFCFNGGDEDWLIATRERDTDSGWLPTWVSATDSYSAPYMYELDDDLVVYVGCHA